MNAAPRSFRAGSTTRRAGGFTLMELAVVVALVGILSVLILPQMKGTYQDALLRSSGRELLNAFNLAYSRAVSFNQPHRVRFDRANGRYAVEKSMRERGGDVFVPLADVSGASGELDSRVSFRVQRPNETPAAEEAPGDSSADDGAPMEFIRFYPDGTADAAQVVLRDTDGFNLVLRINPVTARVRVLGPERELAENGGGR